jgi:preprotein translocase subunit SecE
MTLQGLFKIEKMRKIIQYIKDSKDELKKVVWPSKKELINHTLIVIGLSLAMAFFLGLIDFGLTKLVEILIK